MQITCKSGKVYNILFTVHRIEVFDEPLTFAINLDYTLSEVASSYPTPQDIIQDVVDTLHEMPEMLKQGRLIPLAEEIRRTKEDIEHDRGLIERLQENIFYAENQLNVMETIYDVISQ